MKINVHETGFEVKYLRCIVETCGASNKLIDGDLENKSHIGHTCEPDPTKYARLDILKGLFGRPMVT